MANQVIIKDQIIGIGDRISVHLRIQEDQKSRIQEFEGVVMAIKGNSNTRTITVRKIGAHGVGVERILPVNSPFIEKVDIKAKGSVRRSKLYYLRSRVGRAALRIKEKKAYTN